VLKVETPSIEEKGIIESKNNLLQSFKIIIITIKIPEIIMRIIGIAMQGIASTLWINQMVSWKNDEYRGAGGTLDPSACQ